jgi:hypothetical protein
VLSALATTVVTSVGFGRSHTNADTAATNTTPAAILKIVLRLTPSSEDVFERSIRTELSESVSRGMRVKFLKPLMSFREA